MDNLEFISSGSLRLDIALGTGGLPRGAVCEISGPIGSGKTSLCLSAVADAQKQDLICGIIDIDHTLDIRYAKQCGVNLDRLVVSQPLYAEQALDIAFRIIRSSSVGCLVFDSLNSLTARAESAPGSEPHPGEELNRLLSQFLRRIKIPLERSRTTLIITNNPPPSAHIVYHRLKHNPARVAIHNHAAVRGNLSLIRMITDGNQIIGQRSRVRIIKNIRPCLGCSELDIMYNNGIIRSGEIFDLAMEMNLIEQRGKYYQFGERRLGPGRSAVIEYIDRYPGFATALEQIIRQRTIE